MTVDEKIRVGDVVIDLALGCSMQVVGVHGPDAGEWREEKGTDLLENYGDSRFSPAPDDTVFECVLCSTVGSEPPESEPLPESRLVRVETEAAFDGTRVQDRVRTKAFADLLSLADEPELYEDLQRLMSKVTTQMHLAAARDLAETRHVATDGDDEGGEAGG